MVVVGAVGAPYGVKGWVRVRSFTEPPANLLDYEPWRIRQGGNWREVAVAARRHGQGFVARIDQTEDRTAASALTGASIGVAAAALPSPAPNEYYWSDLVGRRVVRAPRGDEPAASERQLGVVARVFATPAHDVLVVAGDGAEHLVPFVRQVVTDVAGDRVVVDWDPDWQ